MKEETREELKKRIFKEIEKVFEHHLDNVLITDETNEDLFCKAAYIDHADYEGDCPEPQTLTTLNGWKTHSLKIEIYYVEK